MPGLVDQIGAIGNRLFSSRKQLTGIAFIDVEVGYADGKPHDFGSVRDDGRELHSSSHAEFVRFIEDAEFLCGHNIIHHDLKYLADSGRIKGKKAIDTLYLSPLLFPKRPYHKLLKGDGIDVRIRNYQ